VTELDLPVDPGLMQRFRAAGAQVTWRPANDPPPPRASKSRKGGVAGRRIARLHEEEALVEETPSARAPTLLVDSGPVGALVLLLEIDRRGRPTYLVARDARERKEFPNGAIEAGWGSEPVAGKPPLPLRDLVDLARYALP